MSLETMNDELPKRKKIAAKPKAAKPVADRHRPEPDNYVDALAERISVLPMLELEAHQAAVNDLVASRRAARLEALQAEAAALGAKVTLPGSRKGVPAPVKYRDPETGNTWAGRGLKPKWLTDAINAGESIEEYAV